MTDESTTPAAGGDEGSGGTADESMENRLRHLLDAGAAGGGGDGLAAVLSVTRRVRRRRLTQQAAAFCTAAALAVVTVASVDRSHSGQPLTATPSTPAPSPAIRLTGALISFDACSDYLSYMKSQALAVVGPYGLQTGSTDGRFWPGMLEKSAASTGAAASAGATSNGALAPEFQQAAGAAGGTGSATFSTTDDQVAGVDEPDTVKTDGHVVVTLVGSTLRVLGADSSVQASLQLPGDTGGGLLLAGDRVLVLSSGPTSTPGTAAYVPAYYGAAPVVSTPAQARVSVVDLSNPDHPTLARSFLFDGSIVSARLVGGQVRLVLRSDGPRLAFADSSGTDGDSTATAANKKLIQASTTADWLPAWQLESPDGATSARQPLTDCSSVARPRQSSGLSTVTVLGLDPSAAAPGPATSVVAAGSTVYATATHLYVAGPTGGAHPYSGAMPSGCCSLVPPARASTAIYEFSTPSSGRPVFGGAGTVPGWLVNSYAMDEDAAGRLRVASTSRVDAPPPSGLVTQWSADTQSQITVLALRGGDLTQVGMVGGLGRGEFIKTVRFVGPVAYVVTFRSFDPLYVVDLADPTRPALSGELTQPGFSEFLYPVSDRILIGVGVQITNGEPSGLVAATYDVSDPSHPRQVASATLASGYQYVAGGYDPHAFLYWPATQLALLAVPDNPAYGSTSGSSGVAAFVVAPTGGLTRAGTLRHGSDATTRSVVIAGQVWAFSDAGVLTAPLSDLSATAWHGY